MAFNDPHKFGNTLQNISQILHQVDREEQNGQSQSLLQMKQTYASQKQQIILQEKENEIQRLWSQVQQQSE